MAKCFNRNTPEYKALEGEYGDVIVINSIIDKWQKSTNSDAFPTVYQAKEVCAK